MVTESKPTQHSDHTHPRNHTSESATQLDTRATKDTHGTTPGYGQTGGQALTASVTTRERNNDLVRPMNKNMDKLGIIITKKLPILNGSGAEIHTAGLDARHTVSG